MTTNSSVFQAGLMLLEDVGTQPNCERNYRKQSIAIISDNQTPVMALNYNTIRSKLVWEWLGKLNVFGRENRIALCWVLRHTGINGNEKAILLPKMGATTSTGIVLWNRDEHL